MPGCRSNLRQVGTPRTQRASTAITLFGEEPTGSSASDYSFMKGKVASGVSNVGSSDYENMNFGLCRILIPVILGKISKSAMFISDESLNDQAWDAVTLSHYKGYMQDKVFTPAGVSNASFAPVAGHKKALAYPFPVSSGKLEELEKL